MNLRTPLFRLDVSTTAARCAVAWVDYALARLDRDGAVPGALQFATADAAPTFSQDEAQDLHAVWRDQWYGISRLWRELDMATQAEVSEPDLLNRTHNWIASALSDESWRHLSESIGFYEHAEQAGVVVPLTDSRGPVHLPHPRYIDMRDSR